MLRTYLLLLFWFSVNSDVYALNSSLIEQNADVSIKELYHTINLLPSSSMEKRLNWFSNYFIGTPYILGSLGEGAKGFYDQYPLYRSDAFDCQTYVDTVLALALSNSLTQFKHCINKIRYHQGKVSYIKRNHFTSIDWNNNNQQAGILKDITQAIHDRNNHSVAIYTTTLIDKPSWYAHKESTAIRVNNINELEVLNRLKKLKLATRTLDKNHVKVPYIPFTALFPQKGKPNVYLFSQIPSGAIIEIVRPSWDLRKEIGTYLDISHLGFAFWQEGILYFRQASSNYGKIVDVPLIDYLREATNSPTIKGINIQMVMPSKAGNCGMA